MTQPWFRTPAGRAEQRGFREFRAPLYMRSLAVGAIQAALDGRKRGIL